MSIVRNGSPDNFAAHLGPVRTANAWRVSWTGIILVYLPAIRGENEASTCFSKFMDIMTSSYYCCFQCRVVLKVPKRGQTSFYLAVIESKLWNKFRKYTAAYLHAKLQLYIKHLFCYAETFSFTFTRKFT